MDVSRLDEMPPGRQPIDTRVIAAERLDGGGRRGSRGISTAGGQAYWVCPMVEESETSDLAAAEARLPRCCARGSATRSGWSTAS